MIRPAPPFVVATAVVVAPLCAVAGLYPELIGICCGGLALFAAVAIADAARAARSLAVWKASTPPALRWFKDRQDLLPLSIEHAEAKSTEARIHIAFPAEIETRNKIVVAEAERAGVVEIACTPRRRGDFTLRTCSIERRSSLHLWFASRALPIASEIRVYPDLRRERATDLIRSRNLMGTHRRRQLGKGKEFEKLREYEHGDSFEDIDWKATARRQKPVVKVFQIERTQDAYAIIDSSRLSARAGALDAYVTAALTLAIAAESQHDRFGLASFSAGVDAFRPAASGKRHFASCRDAIYALQPSTATPDLEEVLSFLHTRVRRRSLIVFLTALDDPFLAEAFLKNIHVLSRRHVVMVNVPEVRDVRPLFSGALPENYNQIYTKLAGHMQWVGLRELQKTLQRHGVRVAIVNAASLPGQLTRQYLDVKQGQLL